MPAIAELLELAREAAKSAYAPFSNFRVGAAVSAGGNIFTGCNIENASFGLTICAERVAIFKAVSTGVRKIDAIAVACIDAPLHGNKDSLMPCGACRQVMAEFAEGGLPVVVDRAGDFTLERLLPSAFRLPQT